jgi:N6-L-threonylcarbamoyladenine synthase
MYVLGIETSCDETAASVVKDGRKILSNAVISSLGFHKKYGGVVPEIAFRMQLEAIAEIVDSAIKEARIGLKKIGLVSVTNGPGLLGSLLVGISFAKSISFSLGVPLLGINHLYSHIYASFLENSKIEFPFVSLVVSGGHTSLFFLKDFDKIQLLGSTQDDACGEAFDKVAKILGLGYPGGPLIEQLSKRGDAGKIRLGCSKTKNPFDFSFSGIKTAVLYYVQKTQDTSHYPISLRRDVAASFQETVIDTLIKKSIFACKLKKSNRLVIGGGVAANGRLRQKFNEAAMDEGIRSYFPSRKLCMDNAAMVAGLGYQLFKRGYKSGLDLNVDLDAA